MARPTGPSGIPGPSNSTMGISTRRLEAYTDGVFAIAATLLVLDLSIEGFSKVHTNLELWVNLTALSSNLLSFVISFLLLGLTWSIHVNQFEYVTSANGVVIFLNTLRLLAVVLIPFTTSINSNYPDLWLGRILLPINFFFLVLFGSVQWLYLTSPKHSMVERLDDEAIRASRRNAIIPVYVSAAVIILAPFVGSFAFFLFILNNLADRILPKGKATRRSDLE